MNRTPEEVELCEARAALAGYLERIWPSPSDTGDGVDACFGMPFWEGLAQAEERYRNAQRQCASLANS